MQSEPQRRDKRREKTCLSGTLLDTPFGDFTWKVETIGLPLRSSRLCGLIPQSNCMDSAEIHWHCSRRGNRVMPMSIAEVHKLPLREKLQIMEAIWLDLRQHVDGLDAPQSHRKLLDSRRQRALSGEASIRDWDQVKQTIGRP